MKGNWHWRGCAEISGMHKVSHHLRVQPVQSLLSGHNATAQDAAGETITFRWNGGINPLEKVKAGTGYAMASNVTAFTVTNAQTRSSFN